ncbi:MAG: leucyl aminopeptidase [Burkholderiaceae bacterium]|nr:leucyl aminopeptidase [Burkholderiaceae bacterium]
MECNTKIALPETFKADCVAVGVFEGGGLTASARRIDAITRGALRTALASGDLTGARGTSLLLRGLPGVASARVLLVGLGKSDEFGERAFAEAVRTAVKGAGRGTTSLAISAGEWIVKGRDPRWHASMLVVAAREVPFRSDELKTKKDDNPPRMARLHLLLDQRDASVDRGLSEGRAIANGVDLAKRLGNLPANVCTPDFLAQQARKLQKDWGIQVQVLQRGQIEALKMGSFLSVAKGSEQPPRLIVAKYQGTNRGRFANPIALVGKGITFDTGGISLKPAPEMDEMKFDMGGAASVLGTLRAAAELKLKLNIVGVVPACENMPSGRASKPGDIVTSMSGQTIEVLNTDAEGRLILCDALTYVQRFKPAAVIDIATLTGAIVVSLGNVHSGLFSPDDELAAELLQAASRASDRAWRMPLEEDYQDQLKSNFADMANIGVRGNAGSIVAACFLARFTKGMRWAHLDVAGTAFRGGSAKGATGRPVPLLTHFLMARAAA